MTNHIIKYLRRTRPLINIACVEREIGMPSRALADTVSGDRSLPKKWEAPLERWWTSYFEEVAKVGNGLRELTHPVKQKGKR